MRTHIELLLAKPCPVQIASLYTVWFVNPVLGLVLRHDDETLVIAEVPGLETAITRANALRQVIHFGNCRYEAETKLNPGGDILVVRVRCFSSLDRELGEERHLLVGSGSTTELVPRASNEATAWQERRSFRWFEPAMFLSHSHPIERPSA